MLKTMLQKEFRLSMHPITPVMLVLSAMVMIPNYPYTVIFFYTTLALFFCCLTGRENNDVVFMALLPVEKRDIVKGRFAFAVTLEFMQLVLTGLVCLLKGKLNMPANEGGIEANLALPGCGLLLYGCFHAVFFTRYYRNVNKVGAAFVASSTVLFGLICVGEVLLHVLPFARDMLDTADPLHMGAKAAFFAACAVLYVLLTAASYRASVRGLERQDL